MRFSVRNFGYRTFLFWGIFMHSCTFIGHSDCDESIKDKIYSAIEKLINENNVNTFYVGTHGHFDYYAYKTLCELKKIYDIEILVVLSHLGTVPDYCKDVKKSFSGSS